MCSFYVWVYMYEDRELYFVLENTFIYNLAQYELPRSVNEIMG